MNVERLRAAALTVFARRKLAAPLEEIAREAGVGIGTLYNRVGSREALIDAVVPAVAGEKLLALKERSLSQPSPRGRLEAFISCMIDLQLSDPALSDAMLRRFPDTTSLIEICDRSTAFGRDLIDDAHASGAHSRDFTADDLMTVLWVAATAGHDPSAPAGWRRGVDRSIAAGWTT